MAQNGNRPKLSEKGLLTPDNCVLALIDHQPQMLFGVANFDRQSIINNTVAETTSFSGNLRRWRWQAGMAIVAKVRVA